MSRLRTVLAAAALVAAAAVAVAKPAPPVALERRIAESDLIVVGKLKTQPVHCGDAYDVDIEEILKGLEVMPTALRVRSPYCFTGDVELPNQPQGPPKSREAGAKRAIFFCGAEKDGVRDTSDVVTLDPDDGMSATFWIGVVAKYKASFGPAAVKALVELDGVRTDADAGAALWIKGLASGNPLLVEALLDRYRIVAGGNPAKSAVAPQFGEALAQRAMRDAAASPVDLLEAVLARTADKLPPHRAQALCCAAEVLSRADAPERPFFNDVIGEARASLKDADADVRGAGLWLLVAAESRDVVAALTEALQRRDTDAYWTGRAVELALGLAKKSAERRNEMTAMFVALLDQREDGQAWQMDALRKLTNQKFTDAAAWKTWWAARKK
jgi:hypothetical protein